MNPENRERPQAMTPVYGAYMRRPRETYLPQVPKMLSAAQEKLREYSFLQFPIFEGPTCAYMTKMWDVDTCIPRGMLVMKHLYRAAGLENEKRTPPADLCEEQGGGTRCPPNSGTPFRA